MSTRKGMDYISLQEQKWAVPVRSSSASSKRYTERSLRLHAARASVVQKDPLSDLDSTL
jgi:hypothetical protein